MERLIPERGRVVLSMLYIFDVLHFNNYLNNLLKLASHFILGSLEAFCLLNTLKVFTAFSE